jgi:hypothetical protein
MSTRQSTPAVSRRSYTSLASFGVVFYKYEYALNPQTLVEQGTLKPYGINVDCSPGRILYENGKKIVPPQGNFPPILVYSFDDIAPVAPLTSYMVGVFDPQSGLNGYINPNAPVFAINSTDKPVYLNADAGRAPLTDIPNLGNSVLTRGSVLALINDISNDIPLPNYVGVAFPGVDSLNLQNQGILGGPYALAISEGLSNLVSTSLACGEGGDRATTSWAGMYSNGNLHFTGNLYAKNICGSVTLVNGTSGPIAVQAGTSNALVYLTYRTFALSVGGSGLGLLTYVLSGNTLTINSTNANDISVVNWLIVNDRI